MMRVILAAVLLMATAAVAEESPDDFLESPPAPQTMIGASWDSQYIWRGFDVFDDDGAAHVMADMGLFGGDFGVSVVGHQSLGESFGDLQRWDGTFYYQGGLFAGEPLATNFRLGYVYYYYPRANEGRTQDLMEGHAVLSWPNLLPIQGLQPSYAFVYMFPGRDSHWAERANPGFDDNSKGMFHIFMLDYAFTIPVVGLDEQVIKLHSELVYNDGVSPFGNAVDSGLSHAVLGASTDFAFGLARNLVLTPAVYYQLSMEDSVNPDDEFWASLSLKYAF
jgi:hypothetical protein